jgi:AcrR family transcriptional regulator
MKDSSGRDAERKKQILDAAIKTIELSGLDNVTLQGVAQAAGLSKGGVTHYYSSKKQLFLEAFTYFFDAVVFECEKYCDSFESHFDKLLSFDMILKMENPMVMQAHPILHDFIAVAVHDEHYRDIFLDWAETWVRLIKVILNDGIANGSFRPCDVDSTARTLSAAIHGIALRSFMAPQTHSNDWAIDAYHQTIDKFVDRMENV